MGLTETPLSDYYLSFKWCFLTEDLSIHHALPVGNLCCIRFHIISISPLMSTCWHWFVMCYTQNLPEDFWCFCFLFEYGQAVLSFFIFTSVSPVIKTWNRFLNSLKILMVCRAFHSWHLWLWKRRNAFWRHSTTSLCINVLAHSRETYLGSLTFKKFLTYSC